MPTIEVMKDDLDLLLGEVLPVERLGAELLRAKGEIKEYDEKAGVLRIELADSNRPDLWSVEGIARQIRLSKRAISYPFFSKKSGKIPAVIVSPQMAEIRPYLGACIARGLSIDERMLAGLIQTQEKLSEIYGRKRRNVSIGLYRLEKIAFPVHYERAGRDLRFVPLGMSEPMTLNEILQRHPKGVAYGAILEGHDRLPILRDDAGKILSFPPIINSREMGEVRAGDRDLFIEATGTDLRMVMLTVNILACNLADRGGVIEPVEIRFPRQIHSQTVVMPCEFTRSLEVPAREVERILGTEVSLSELSAGLIRSGFHVGKRARSVLATPPPYRDDLMHPADLVEEYAIAKGYDSFEPRLPSTFTVGGLTPLERLSDRVRERMVGLGFEEVISNILASREEIVQKMGGAQEERRLVEIENPMTATFSILRDSLLPSLLKVEAASAKAFYPHRIFEVGEVALLDPGVPAKSRTMLNLAALIAHAEVNFSEIHALLQSLLGVLGVEAGLHPADEPLFIPGRAGAVVRSDQTRLGRIGELHPALLERWAIAMPCVAFEISLEPFLV